MIDKQLIHKYFEKRCTPEELQLMIEWLEDDREDHTLLDEVMQTQWESQQEDNAGEGLKHRLLDDLREQLYPHVMGEESETRSLRPHRRIFRYVAAASVIAVMAISYQLIYNTNRHTKINSSIAAEWISVADTATRIQHLLLPDSTQVWLNPGSSIVYSINPGVDRRLVRLNGQAFFDVRHDAGRPFIVYTGDIATKVLGTAFNIEAYPYEKNIRVSLVSGSVAIQRSAAGNRPAMEEVLTSGKMLTYAKDSGTSRKDPLAITDIADWTAGHIIFNDVPVKIALERLSRLYHFHLTYDKEVSLDNTRFSTVFNDEQPEEMIRNILFITDYTYRLKGNELRVIQKQ
ncbi:MAG: FecR domain-containing protein [Chitinophagaceae bacterium]|nr:FecR domain-containing protein [Chitinophagaceae bacterium]